MRIPLSWLGEIVDLPAHVTPESVHADLVRVGFEEESIRRFDVTGPVVVGQVLEQIPEPQTNGKTINWCQVRVAPEGQVAADGGADVRGIVCGAHNFVVGDKVVVTLPGAVLPGDFAITPRQTYGHVSDGMIASARELSLGDEHDGIIVLSTLGLDPEIGVDAKSLLGLDDTAVEINVTPDRGYAFSLRGVGREWAHATGASFTDPANAVSPAAAFGFPVIIDDQAPVRGRVGATGFIGRVVRGLNPAAPTPPWMITRLQLAGIRSLGLAIDVSNYVMLEIGNPLHAYDLGKLTGAITVRRAQAGETFTTLDGQKRALHPEDLMIADESGPIGLAGVMGGESTKTDDATTDVFIEAATFDPISIARTARRHKLSSEASRRFERGVDPLIGRAAAQRMVDLLVELGGGSADTLGVEIVPEYTPTSIRLRADYPAQVMGVDYTETEVRESLARVGCSVTAADDGEFIVAPPSWRSDLTRPADLVEEVARVVGYDRIPSVLPVAPPGRGLSRTQRLRRRVADSMAAAGFDEVQNYPFISASQVARFAVADAPPAMKLANPLDGESPFLRTSLLPGLVTAAQRNVSRGSTDLALVEFGSVFLSSARASELGTDFVPPLAERPSLEVIAQLDASLPRQPRHAAVLLAGLAVAKQPGESARPFDWADAIDAARLLAAGVGAQIEIRQGVHPGFHPGRTAELLMRTADGLLSIGFAGELSPEVVAESHLYGRVSMVELDLDALMELAPREPKVGPLSTFPAATQDLTMVVSAEVPASELLAAVIEGAGELLERATLVDDYRASGVPEGQKAITLALRFRADDRTLKAEEASEAKLAGLALASARFGAALRE